MAKRRPTFLFATILATCLAGPAATSHAQFGGQAGFADAFRIDFLERDLPLFVETLKLEDWQRPIVESLLQDYQVSFTAGIEQVREKMRASSEQIASSREDEVMKIILQPLEAWETDRLKYRDDFLRNVKAQLSGDQLARWPHFERTLRRDKALPKGEIMGESIDLFVIVRNMRMPYEIEESTEPVLMEYELELDTALKARQLVMDNLQEEIKDAMAAMDFDAGLAAMDQIMGTRVKVREVQDAYITRVSEVLPDEWASSFLKNALAKAYPKVFRPNPIDKLLETVREIPSLTESQHEQLDQIEIDFHAQLSALEERLLASYRLHEPQNPRRKVEKMLDNREGVKNRNVEPTQMDVIAGERNDLISETRRRILAILSPEQIGDMPGTSARQKAERGRRPRLPMGAPPPGSVATPTMRSKTPPKFGPSDGGEAPPTGPSRIDPTNPSNGGKSRED